MELVVGKKWVIDAPGIGDPITSSLSRFLIANGACSVITILHPFGVGPGIRQHKVIHVTADGEESTTFLRTLHIPPVTYLRNLSIGRRFVKECDVWVGLSNLSALTPLLTRKKYRPIICAWYIDFVERRAHSMAPLDILYRILDKFLNTRINLRIELTQQTALSRSDVIGTLNTNSAPVHITPIGLWPRELRMDYQQRSNRLIYLGGLVERLGPQLLPGIAKELKELGWKGTIDVVGDGPLRLEIEKLAQNLHVSDILKIHGFVESRQAVEDYLMNSRCAIALYSPDSENFSRTTDSAKLKSYIQFGLPIVMTDVTTNARALVDEGVALIVDFDAVAAARCIYELLLDETKWEVMSKSAHNYSQQFSWSTLYGALIDKIHAASKT